MNLRRILTGLLFCLLVFTWSCDGDDGEDDGPPTEPTPTYTVRVLFPNGGEILDDTQIQALRWTGSPGVVSYRVWYSSNRGGYWRLLTGANVSWTHWSWDPPFPGMTDGPPVYLIKVVGYDSEGNAVAEDTSDACFSVYRGA